MAYRIYFENDDGTWFRVPHKAAATAGRRTDHAFPQFAGSVRRQIDVMYDPGTAAVQRIWGSYCTFDGEGRPDWGLERHADLLRLTSPVLEKSEVASLDEARKLKEAREKSQWVPDGEIFEAILSDIRPRKAFK